MTVITVDTTNHDPNHRKWVELDRIAAEKARTAQPRKPLRAKATQAQPTPAKSVGSAGQNAGQSAQGGPGSGRSDTKPTGRVGQAGRAGSSREKRSEGVGRVEIPAGHLLLSPGEVTAMDNLIRAAERAGILPPGWEG